ncbi:MAG: LmbE family N-acetylglucosaminyl deacetylase [Candidatus Paceibacteria bacterium]|jgi:LmbE family N-acetylglucosaminyl deacetylase
MIEGQRLLVIAPHSDDEVIGCGGTIALAAERGAEVHVLIVFDGAAGDPDGKFDKQGYVQRRRQEAQAAGERLGVSRYTFWDFPEGHLATQGDLESGAIRLAQLVEEWRPDTILAPWSGDDHPDHQSVARAVEGLMWLQVNESLRCE